MKPGFFIFGFLFPVCLFSQTPRIDNLRKILSLLKDSARVDSINVLGLQFIDQSEKDSAEYYTRLASHESGSLRYFHGLAEARSSQASIQTRFYGNFPEAEKLDKESIGFYDKTNNKAGLAATYAHLAFACFAQSKYDEAIQVQ